ncbi:MAG: hypothetical protein H6R18_1681 [Proteobacteria bacterium]|nr:hypothetical protein [Pseudomonadota bacterium]
MNKKTDRIGLLLLLCSSVALATTDAPASSLSKKMQLAEQKSKLVERLIGPLSDSQTPENTILLANNRRLLEQARTAISRAQPDEAVEKLDEALRNLSRANANLSSEKNASERQKKQFEERAAQIESFRQSLQDMATSPQAANAIQQLTIQIDSLTEEGRKLMLSGRQEDAIKHMYAAYKLAIEEISRLREGQEVVVRLHFNSPREEFAYEQKRYYSNEILVDMMSGQDQLSPEIRKRVESLVKAAVDIKNGAASKAGAHDYPLAIQEMEKAILQLNRALQIMGMPVF